MDGSGRELPLITVASCWTTWDCSGTLYRHSAICVKYFPLCCKGFYRTLMWHLLSRLHHLHCPVQPELSVQSSMFLIPHPATVIRKTHAINKRRIRLTEILDIVPSNYDSGRKLRVRSSKCSPNITREKRKDTLDWPVRSPALKQVDTHLIITRVF